MLKIPAQCITAGIDESLWRPSIQTDTHDHFAAGMNIVHVATQDRSILLDTGVGQPHPLLTQFTNAFAFEQTASLLTCLASLGIQPQDITDVIFSHAHDDHIMGATIESNGKRIPTFPNARHLMISAEWDHATRQNHPDSAFCTHLEILKNHQCLQLINGTYVVAPGIQIVPSPGESAGMPSCA